MWYEITYILYTSYTTSYMSSLYRYNMSSLVIHFWWQAPDTRTVGQSQRNPHGGQFLGIVNETWATFRWLFRPLKPPDGWPHVCRPRTDMVEGPAISTQQDNFQVSQLDKNIRATNFLLYLSWREYALYSIYWPFSILTKRPEMGTNPGGNLHYISTLSWKSLYIFYVCI